MIRQMKRTLQIQTKPNWAACSPTYLAPTEVSAFNYNSNSIVTSFIFLGNLGHASIYWHAIS